MAQRIIRNDFVAGEISPELWGRHDVDVYYHGAAKIENFVPRRTGGLRKRAGTELVDVFGRAREENDPNDSTESRAVPYKYDKDQYGILLIYRDVGETRLRYSFYSSKTQTHTAGASISPAVVTLPASASLADIRYTQIGDTIFFTHPGITAWKAIITFSTASVAWESLSTAISVATPNVLNGSAQEFTGTTAGTREYRLWGVKNGVRSVSRYRKVSITLPWTAGAYVTLTFTPDWTKHDYYILGKLQGGQYGEVSRFYPETSDNNIASFFFSAENNSYSQYGDAHGTTTGTYKSNATNSQGWVNRKPDDKTGDVHTYGVFARGIRADLDGTKQVTGIKIWFGAVMTEVASEAAMQVGCNAEITAVILDGNDTPLGTHVFVPGYNTGPVELGLNEISVAAAEAEKIKVLFYTGYESQSSPGTQAYVPVRGMRVVCSKTETCSFKDDNIQPGTLVGEQTALRVGQTDMDVNLITAWQQRLVAAGSASLPFTMWFSAIGDLYNFYTDTPQTSDNAFDATIASTEANRINHIVAQKWLLVFTESGEYIISSTGGALAFNTIDVKQLSGVVAHNAIPPVCTESEVLFVAHDGRSVYKMDYTLERDSVVPTNLSIRAEHVAAKAGIVAIAYQRFPDSVLWCLLADGSLASLTFCPEENVCAWAHHTLSGGAGLRAVDIFATGSVSSVAGTATTSDIFLVLRNDNDPDKTWIERLRPNVIVDSPATETALCADHVGYDSSDIQPLVLLEDGTLAGADPKGEISASFETIRMEPQQEDTIGRSAAQFDATLRVLRSGIVAVRPIEEDRDDPSRTTWRSSAPQARKIPVEDDGTVLLVRGDVRISPQVLHSREARFEVKSADPWPCDILALCVAGHFGNMRNGG